jgi:hypothetical protein
MRKIIMFVVLALSSVSYAETLSWDESQERILSEVNKGYMAKAWCLAWPYIESKDPDALAEVAGGVITRSFRPTDHPQDAFEHLRLTFILSFQALAENDPSKLEPFYLEVVRRVLDSELFRSDARKSRACLSDSEQDYASCLELAREANLLPTWEQFVSEQHERCR